MKWEPRRTVRKREIAALREEGRQAALAGKHRQHCPPAYLHTMNHLRWLEGYDAAVRTMAEEDGPT